MTRADQTIERAADKLQELANRAASGNGVKAKLAQELATDAEFLRKLKPSLIAARARGERPAAQPTPPAPSAPPQARAEKPKKEKKRKNGGPSPILIVGAAFATGILLAKVVDWRGHAHPRD